MIDLIKAAETLSPRVRVIPHPRARRLALRVNSGRQTIDLVIPRRVPLGFANAFLHKNSCWIERHVALLPAPRPFIDGAMIDLMGKAMRLNIQPNPTGERTIIDTPTPDILRIRTHLRDPTEPVFRYLRKTVCAYAQPKTEALAHQINRRVTSVSVKKMTSRWGSCAPDGRLSFSVHLAFVPLWALDYVLAHEVAHLAHFDHSAAFWKTCRTLCPRTDEARAWFNAHGQTVWGYGAAISGSADGDGSA